MLQCVPIIPSNHLKMLWAIFICMGNRSAAVTSLKGIHDPATYRRGNTGVKRQTFQECYIFTFLNDQVLYQIL